MSQAITTRQEIKKAGQAKTMFVKGEKEGLAKYNADGQAIVRNALGNASLSMEQVHSELSTAVARGFNDFASNYNTALLWFILQESINSRFGLDLFAKLEKTFHIIAGAGINEKDDKGRFIFNKKESIISVTKKESDTEKGKYIINIGLKSGNTRADIAKAWNKRKAGELKGQENIVSFLLAKYDGKPAAQAKPKKEESLADIVARLAAFHDTCSDKAEQAKAKAMLDAYKK